MFCGPQSQHCWHPDQLGGCWCPACWRNWTLTECWSSWTGRSCFWHQRFCHCEPQPQHHFSLFLMIDFLQLVAEISCTIHTLHLMIEETNLIFFLHICSKITFRSFKDRTWTCFEFSSGFRFTFKCICSLRNFPSWDNICIIILQVFFFIIY